MKLALKSFIIPASILTLLTGCHGNKDKEREPKATPKVEVTSPVVEGVTDYLTIPGTIQSNSKVDVVCRVNGRLLTKHFQPGDYVNKGQLLFSIESREYRDAVNQEKASLASARSQYDYALQHLTALKKAYEANAVAQITVLEAESALEQAKASVHTAEAALNEAQLQLSYCSITAPISGTISDTSYSVGSYISGSGEPVVLATIVNNDDLKVMFSVEESEYKQLPASDDSLYNSVPLKFREPMDRDYTARLYYKSPSIDTSTGLMSLMGKVNNPSSSLRDGMYCTISLPLGYNPHAILVLDASIGTDQLGKYLYVVSDSNKIVKQHITVGPLWQDTLRVVNSGIKTTDKYVVKALMSVREGEKVDPISLP